MIPLESVKHAASVGKNSAMTNQTLTQWAQKVTPDRFVKTAIRRLSGKRPDDMFKALKIVDRRARKDKALNEAWNFMFGSETIVDAINCPDKFAKKAERLIRQKWGK